MKHLRDSATVTRQTHQVYRGRPLLIQLSPDGVSVWPKGTRRHALVNLAAAYERALANGAPPLPTGKQLGMTRRNYTAMSRKAVAQAQALIPAGKPNSGSTLTGTAGLSGENQ